MPNNESLLHRAKNCKMKIRCLEFNESCAMECKISFALRCVLTQTASHISVSELKLNLDFGKVRLYNVIPNNHFGIDLKRNFFLVYCFEIM